MKQFTLPALVRLVLVLAVAVLLSTGIDPHLDLGSPILAQALNAVLPLILVLLVWGLTGRAWLALAAEVILLAALEYADRMKLMYLSADLVYADLTVVGSLLEDPHLVLGFIHLTLPKVAGAATGLAAILAVWWYTRRLPRASRWFRIGCTGTAVVAMAVVWTYQAPDVVESLQWEVFAQAQGADVAGIAGNLMLGRMTTRDVKRAPDVKAERAFWHEPLVISAEQPLAKQGDGRRPDVVIIQSESLFQPSQLCGFSDKPVLARMAQQEGGNLHVPVFGGRTLQTEFETLTGAPIAFYPGSMFAYYELVDHDIDALPRVLHGVGYQTTFIHPNERGFWRRGAAIPYMGFATFQDIGSFVAPRDFSERGHVSDLAVSRAILAELDSADRPAFVTAVTMDNHGPWGEFAPKNDTSLGLPAKLVGKGRTQMADYVARAIDADKAYGFLIDALQRRGRPTIVLIYGDHLPALPAVYDQLCFKNGKSPEEQSPPYRVWANFPLPPAPHDNASYLMSGWLMRAAGLPLRGHVLADTVAGLIASDPAVVEPDRTRVLSEYANIAAANVRANASRRGAVKEVFVGSDHALVELLKLESHRDVGAGALQYDSDMYLPPTKDASAELTFNTHASVASLTLRPYVGASLPSCLGATEPSNAAMTVTGDGRVLYRAAVEPRALRLATLDLRGVQQLVIRVDHAETADMCARVYIRVAQMLCYSAQCDVPGSALPASAPAPGSSRILADDPIAGDMAALNGMVSKQQLRINTKMANLRWMIGREKASQQGFSPFEVGDDAQLLMPPADDHTAWINFDVTGVATLELTPHINPLSGECKAMNEPGKVAGTVGLTVSLDGKPVVPRFEIDRFYHDNLSVPVNGGHILRIEVDKGNEVSWCDWFSVGFNRIDRGAPVAVSDANHL